MVKTDNLTDFLADVADAIREKKGTTGAINPQDFSREIASIKTSGATSAALVKAVNFYDYDGSILYSFTATEFANQTALPKLPESGGLICQGWNWSLEDAKAYVANYGKLNIGAMYITDDGDTRLYIRIATEGRMTVPLYWSQTVANGVSIDWGDGSAIESFSDTGNKNTTHTYANPGDYVIRLKVADGCTLGLGDGSSYCVMGHTNNNGKVYCNMLQKVEIGTRVASIGNNAFFYCYSLASVSIPNGVTSIGNYAFNYCHSLASITIPSSVASIGYSVFESCHSLASITIPSTVTSIGNSAFRSCYSLASITIPNGVTSIGHYAFYSCYSLASITIPSSVTSISSYAFQSCYSLASITIPNGVTSISDYVFQNCHSLASIPIPSSVTSIGISAFDSCNSLASITIPNSVTSIGIQAFRSCYSLASITIPSSVTSIGNSAFQNCYSLASITIPSSVAKIDYSTFQSCSGMAIYDFTNHTSVPTLANTSAFTNIPTDCVIKVPSSLLEEWKAATNWSTYASQIVGV